MENQPAILKPESDDRRIALPDKNGLNFFDLGKIIRCQSDNSYTDFFILDESIRKKSSIKVVVSKGFEHFEDFMTAKGFFYRVHNQHIVNVNHIKKYIKNNGGYLIMDDNTDTMIPIARARKENFLNHLKLRGIIL
jgi:two-component system LytT family response regulator